MNRIITICIIILLFAPLWGIELNYSEIDELYEGENFSVYAIIIGGSQSIQDIHLIIENDMEKKEYAMSIDGNSASIYVARDQLPQNSFTYYFRITLKDRTSYLYPENPALRIQNTVRVVTMKEKTGYEIHAVYPERTSIISEENFHIAVYVSGDHKKKGLILDDIDITHECEIGENLIIFYPDSTINKGVHRINVTVNGFIMDEWGFTIGEVKHEDFSINGNVGIYSNYRINPYDSAASIRTDTVQIRNRMNIDINGFAGPGSYNINADIDYNDFVFNDFSNTYSLNYTVPGISLTLGDSRVLWNRGMAYSTLCRGGMLALNRGIFEFALTGGYAYTADSLFGHEPDMQYMYGINTGISMPNLTMLLHIMNIETMKDWNTYSSLYGGSRLQLRALGMIAVNADISYRIMQTVENISPVDSSLSLYEEEMSLENALNAHIDINVHWDYFSILLFGLKRGMDLSRNASIDDNSQYSGIKTIIPVLDKNADIGVEYAFLSYDSIINRQHRYNILFNYHNGSMPLFHLRFTHRLPMDSVINAHILTFHGDISHNFMFMGKHSRFNIFIQQHTGNYADSIKAYNKTGSGGNISIIWNRYVKNTAGFTVSGYSAIAGDIDEHTFHVNTELRFPYSIMDVNAAYSNVTSMGDTSIILDIKRIKTAVSYIFRINGISMRAGFRDYFEFRDNGIMQLPEIIGNIEYQF